MMIMMMIMMMMMTLTLMRSPILQLSTAQRFLALSLGSQVMRDCSGGGTAMITRWHLHTVNIEAVRGEVISCYT